MRARIAAFTASAIAVAALVAWFAWPRTNAVDVIEISSAPAIRVLAVNGTIRPRLSVEVQTPVGGTLTALPYDVGDHVAANVLLARVDDAPQRAAIAQAQAAVASQEATLAQTRRELARVEALGDFVTRQKREEARLAVEQASQELRRLRATLAQARELRGRYELRAPFAGVILERPVDPGQTIGTDTIVYRLADLTAPEVTAEVDEAYAAELAPGRTALITLPARSAPIKGTIIHIEPRVDPTTGAREVRLAVAAPLERVPAGLTVSVNLVVDEHGAAISIPRSAILQADSNPRVRTVAADGLVGERSVRFLDWPAASVIVTQGLKPGMRILADPAASEPGSRVRTRD